MSAGSMDFRSRIHPLMASALVALIVIGFARTYYLRFLSDLPPLPIRESARWE